MKLAYCGLRCDLCEVYIATIENDQNLKDNIVKKWSKDSYVLNRDDISCLGCLESKEVAFKFCGECMVRLCGKSKQLSNCGECDNYPCILLGKAFSSDPENKQRLDICKRNRV